MLNFKVRIYANGTNTRYNNGEGTPEEIISTYALSDIDFVKVLKAFYEIRPDLAG
ncbi:hypothetical protein AB4Z50_06570 [Paenibacillus sp. 2TAB26]|uniref:hypothetical protein n=1 Tax=Paenibacillus sp. 2TAB26 TaxID=3233005 RepID=UPI003F9E1823